MFQLGFEGKVRISGGKVFQMKGLVGAVRIESGSA